MINHWLDEYEALWLAPESPPDLLSFIACTAGVAESIAAVRELALIDLEHRWRYFFPTSQLPRTPATEHPLSFQLGLPRLPIWADYCQLLPSCDVRWLDGVCHEFRVRQFFGDRPRCRDLAARYAEVADILADRLPQLSAELSRAKMTLSKDEKQLFTCRLGGRVEVGRRRFDEPMSPCLIESGSVSRLLIADLPEVNISRAQIHLEFVAKDLLLVQHKSNKGSVTCIPGVRLTHNSSCETPVPCTLSFRGYQLQIGPSTS